MLTWLVNPDEYLGDFAQYLDSRGVRSAVKEELKGEFRSLASEARCISVVAHSGGLRRPARPKRRGACFAGGEPLHIRRPALAGAAPPVGALRPEAGQPRQLRQPPHPGRLRRLLAQSR